jgi:hypothetical protein
MKFGVPLSSPQGPFIFLIFALIMFVFPFYGSNYFLVADNLKICCSVDNVEQRDINSAEMMVRNPLSVCFALKINGIKFNCELGDNLVVSRSRALKNLGICSHVNCIFMFRNIRSIYYITISLGNFSCFVQSPSSV